MKKVYVVFQYFYNLNGTGATIFDSLSKAESYEKDLYDNYGRAAIKCWIERKEIN